MRAEIGHLLTTYSNAVTSRGHMPSGPVSGPGCAGGQPSRDRGHSRESVLTAGGTGLRGIRAPAPTPAWVPVPSPSRLGASVPRAFFSLILLHFLLCVDIVRVIHSFMTLDESGDRVSNSSRKKGGCWVIEGQDSPTNLVIKIRVNPLRGRGFGEERDISVPGGQGELMCKHYRDRKKCTNRDSSQIVSNFFCL